MQKRIVQKALIFTLLCLTMNSTHAQGNTKALCDSLVKVGIQALDENQYTHSLELLTRARVLARNNGWSMQEFMALNNIGDNYRRLSEYGEALNYYLAAHDIAIKKLTTNDEISVLNNVAILYSEEKKYDQASDYFTKVYTIAKENKDTLKVGLCANNLGNLALKKDDTKQAKKFYNESFLLLRKHPKYQVLAKIGLANCNLAEGNTKVAIESAMDLLEKTKNLEFYNMDIVLYTIISESYIKENNLEPALAYIKKAFDKKPNLETKIKLFKLLVEIGVKKGSYGLALQYKDSLFDTTMRFNQIKNEKLYENSKIKFELQNYKNQSALHESKLISERKTFYFILSFVITVILLVLWIVRNHSLKLKQKKVIAERNEQILALELEKEKRESLLLEKQFNESQAISLLEQEKLKNDVEAKNRKLSAKALYLSGRNEMIEEILLELSALPQVSKADPLVLHISSLKNQLKLDNEWDQFITHFEEINQGFLASLKSKHPKLTVTDIRYISYIYMNLSTKEIASLLNISQETCRKRKERILAKLELPKDSDLYNYLTMSV